MSGYIRGWLAMGETNTFDWQKQFPSISFLCPTHSVSHWPTVSDCAAQVGDVYAWTSPRFIFVKLVLYFSRTRFFPHATEEVTSTRPPLKVFVLYSIN